MHRSIKVCSKSLTNLPQNLNLAAVNLVNSKQNFSQIAVNTHVQQYISEQTQSVNASNFETNRSAKFLSDRLASSDLSSEIEKYSKRKPYQLSISEIIEFQESFKDRFAKQLKQKSQNVQVLKQINDDFIYSSIRFAISELPIRIANIIKELEETPLELQELENFKKIYENYKNCFQELLNMNKQIKHNNNQLNVLSTVRYRQFLTKVFGKLDKSTDQDIALAILEYKKIYKLTRNGDIFTNFLNRFYQGRIGIQLLTDMCFSDIRVQNQSSTGSASAYIHSDIGLGKDLNLKKILTDNYNESLKRFKNSGKKFNDLPKLIIKTTSSQGNLNDLPLYTYVQSHLDYIFQNLFDNSIRSSILRFNQDEDVNSIPDIKVSIHNGPTEVTIRITDNGIGGTCSESIQWFNYHFKRYKQETENGFYFNSQKAVKKNPDISDDWYLENEGYGYGLPSSRLYARYLNGDLDLITTEGNGTECFLTLKSMNSEKIECLPNYCPGVYHGETWDKDQSYNKLTKDAEWIGIGFNTSRYLF